MSKEQIKTFVKENKKELLIGAGVVVTGIAAIVIANKWCGKAVPEFDVDAAIDKICAKDPDVDKFVKFIKVCDQFRGDTKSYLPINAEDFAKLAGNNLVKDVNGVGAVVKGAILFCDAVE